MIQKLKLFYIHQYQEIAYAIGIARSEYDKVGSFATPTILALNLVKLFWKGMPWWVIPLILLTATISAYWIGKWLIKLGVPKKSAQLGNDNNLELQEILNYVRKNGNLRNS